MSITTTSTPTYPVPGRPVTLTLTSSGSPAGNFWRLYVTAAPRGSELRRVLDEADAPRVEIASGRTGTTYVFKPEAGGAYVFKAQDYRLGPDRGATYYGEPAFGGGFSGDPDAYPTETAIGSEDTITIYVGQRLTSTIGLHPDTATLVCWVFNSTIRRTFREPHGEATPKLIDPTTAKARISIEATAVESAVDALVDVTASTALGTPSSVLDNLISKYNSHRAQASVHASNDTDNDVARAFDAAGSNEGLARALQATAVEMSRHMSNDNAGAGIGSASYHLVSTNKVDWENWAKLQRGGGSTDQTLAALALMWDAYEAHRVSAVHTTTDSTNTATALPALLAVHRQFAAACADATPTTPAPVHPATAVLVNGAGFREG